MKNGRETWNTHTGMILAMIGTEVGLGNIWRFPYLVGSHGGGSFLIPYLILLLGCGPLRDDFGVGDRTAYPA